MTTKTAYYASIAEEAACKVTSNRERWTSFLTTAARLNKYPYNEQLMIHAQRPDATACAEYDLWNEKMNRYVKRGSKGIALLDYSREEPRLRYVFDVSDTGTRINSREVNLWKMQDEHREFVQSALEKAFDVSAHGTSFELQVEDIAIQLVTEYWEDNKRHFFDIIENSFLEGYDELNIEMAFRNAATASITYAIYSRCVENYDEYFEHDDFANVFDFNTRQSANALGTAVSEITSKVFREIERSIKNYERNKQAERSYYNDERIDLQTRGRLSDPEHRVDTDREETIGQVRENEKNISSGKQEDALQRSDSERKTISTSLRDRRNGKSQIGTVDERVSSDRTGTRQDDSSDVVGSAHELVESTSRGNDNGGTYQQLTLNLFATEQEQIDFIDRVESRQTPSTFSFAQKEIDHFLRLGSNADNARKQVVNLFEKQKSVEDIAEALKNIYRGGYGIKEGKYNISSWYADNGIHLAKGTSSQYVSNAQVILWEDVAKRIGELIDTGDFASNVELQEAFGYERKKVAEYIWYMIHDMSDEARKLEFMPIVRHFDTGGFPSATENLAEQLKDKEMLSAIIYELEMFNEAYKMDSSLMRFRFHTPSSVLERAKELELPRKEFQSEMPFVPVMDSFITDDEINAALGGGSSFSGGKKRIYDFFQERHTREEQAKFLRDEYGTGGRSHALSFATGSGESYDGRGLRFEKENCDKVHFSWHQVATRIESLVSKGRYLIADKEVDKTVEEEIKEPETQMEELSEEVSEDRFVVTQTSDAFEAGSDFAVWDNQKDDYHIESDGTIQTFETEVEADAYLETVKEEYAEPTWNYKVGDTVYLDDTAFQIEEIRNREITLCDPSLYYPISRVESRERLELLLEQDNRNNRYKKGYVADITDESVTEKQKAVPAYNYHITSDELGEGGSKLKFTRNVAAIKTLLELEEQKRYATPEEQEILANYVGWGGLADAFDANKSNWTQEYTTLKNLLTEEEYAAARASTLNAHYTSPTVIRAIYDAVGQMGFEAGNILEPSMGVGNFFGMLPPEMQRSKLYGVELDSITGRIAQKLYPNAEIKVAGFETTDRRDFYDLAVGNVPFGNYKVSDKPYDKLGFSIHNYFFAKALDQVRPGGVVAFVTSRYTMDSKNSDARRYIAQRADLLGAIRLPNDAFKKNAGAEVVSDIIFLQKKDRPIDIVPDWVHLGQTDDGLAMNSYFINHPEMVLGEIAKESTPYGKDDLTVKPYEDKELTELLKGAVANIKGSYQSVELVEADELGVKQDTIPADPDVKNYSYAVVDGEVYFRENSIMRHCDLNEKAKERVRGMVELRQIVNELIEYQLEDFPDAMIRSKQKELDIAYDDFTAKNGLINSRANGQAFSEDSSYYLLCSLEDVDEDGNLRSKADMFTKRTIKPERRVTSVDTPSEALAISIGERGKVDLPYMANLLGTPDEYETIISELRGIIFKDPMSPDDTVVGWQTADEYLSGDVRSKLRIAQMAEKRTPDFAINVKALEQAQPKDLDASEIDVRLGATWINTDYIQEFMEDTFEPPYYLRRGIEVKYSDITAEWRITGKSTPSHNDVAAYVTYGTSRANAYRILEETLNLKDIRIYDTIEDADGKQKRVLNKKETTLAQQKQQAIKDAFANWIWKDPLRREQLVTRYNELFNSTRPREYDGSHIRFGGMNPDIKLREHQKNAIAHVLYGGNTLLAHEVGAGKTFEMAASAMESKRLGLSQKSLFVVPNHLTTQWANEFLYLYPSAKLLVATKKDFETANRKKFCARIATGDYDAVIIGHSQFEKIPLSAERQERQIREQIDEIEGAIAELKYQQGENFTIKQMEKTRKSLETRLDKLLNADKKDDVVTFEQLGVDRLFVDESHAFKNLFLYTKMRNVAGLSTSEAQKSSDMFMKCRYMDELTGGRGVIFATGTPVSNSMTELYTVMRYLQYATLQQKGLTHFDCWASTFGETSTAIELAPEGTGYRARTRFAKFFNLPELMNMFKEVADIKTSDQLHLPVPEAKFETVVVQPSDFQKDMVAELSERASAVHSGAVDPSVDNMLKITSDGRKIGLDQRLMNPLLPDDPDSKLNSCVNNVIRIWEDGKADKLTQLVFCDLSTPKNDGTFNVYDDIKAKLLAHGVPENEVAFIHDADTEAKKKELFAKVRTGQVRVLLGSTQKMGAGTNVQDLLVAVHHLDVGWRPSDMTQRNGRIIRQGNKNKEVQVYQYVTEGTFDAYLYQTLENKQKFISQIMTSKSPVRSCDDVDEQALSYAEIKALCAGNPMIKEKMDLDIEVARLKVLKADHQSQQYRLEDNLLKYFPAEIEKQNGYINGFEADIRTVQNNPQIADGFCGLEINGKVYTEKNEAGEAIIAMCKTMKDREPKPIGSYRGFQMELSYDSFRQEFEIMLKGAMSHRVALGTDARGNITRLDNGFNAIPERLEYAKTQLENLHKQKEAAKLELGKPFPQEDELSAKSQRLAELDAALNMDDHNESRETEERPSVLADLKSKSDSILPAKKSQEHGEEVL